MRRQAGGFKTRNEERQSKTDVEKETMQEICRCPKDVVIHSHANRADNGWRYSDGRTRAEKEERDDGGKGARPGQGSRMDAADATDPMQPLFLLLLLST